MLKRSWIASLGIAALVALCWSDSAVALLATNGLHLANGIHLSNGLMLSNGINLGNGINLANGVELSTTSLQAVRLALPDGTEVNFR